MPVSDFSALFFQYLQRTLYSYSQLAQLAGVPRRTIANWCDGTVRRPRNWRNVVKVAGALRLRLEEAEMLVAAAGFPSLHALAASNGDEETLFAPWQEHLFRTANHAGILRRYLRAMSRQLSRLPPYIPEAAHFDFQSMYRDMYLRRVVYNSATDEPPAQNFERGQPWSQLRRTTPRAVILGQPGMGKTWLLKSEAQWYAASGLDAPESEAPTVLPLFVRLPELAALLDATAGLPQMLLAVARVCARLTPNLPEDSLCAAIVTYLNRSPDRVVLLLDALDEVPDRDGLRETARQAVLRIGAGTPARVMLASRILGYSAAPLGRYLGTDVVELEIQPLEIPEIMSIMRVWFKGRTDSFDRLYAAMRRAPALIRQASNPLLLSLLCMLTDTHPDAVGYNRSRIYDPVLRLLLEGRWRNLSLQLPESRTRAKLRILEVIAWHFATHRDTWWERLSGDVLDRIIEPLTDTRTLWMTWQPTWAADYEGPLWELSEWDGILVKGFVPADGAASAVPYAFLHRTFQEYLVSRYLVRRYHEGGLDAPEVHLFLTNKAGQPEWSIVLLLLVEQLTTSPSADVQPLLDRLAALLLSNMPDQTGQLAVAGAEMLLNLRESQVGARIAETMRRRLLRVMRKSTTPVFARVHAGRLLAGIGDPREEVLDVDAIPFVRIPAGRFWMGSDPEADLLCLEDEFPAHPRATPEYWISRYPISNAQYRAFLADPEGYTNPELWPEAIALGHWRDGYVWRMSPQHGPDGRLQWRPDWAQKPTQSGWPVDLDNGPIMGINWYEARAFVRWLERRWRRLGLLAPHETLHLPSEAEWEKAARGEHKYMYPWGDEFDPGRLNWHGHMLLSPTPIGSFPNSASPYGVEDLVGNLWEWTRTIYVPYSAPFQDSDYEPHASGDARIQGAPLALRGGAYYTMHHRCRCAARLAGQSVGNAGSTFRIVRLQQSGGGSM